MYTLKPLSFLYQDLEPFIDSHTMGLHIEKHQRGYLNQLNRLLEKNHFTYAYPIEEIYSHLDFFPERILNDLLFYLGGVCNHDIYWNSIDPKEKESPKGILLEKINNQFSSFEKFKEKFLEYALALKGSGYVFLVKKHDGSIDIVTTANQDSPLLRNQQPLFCIDLWEHAYYLNYKNNKQEYIDNFFQIANFSYANKHI